MKFLLLSSLVALTSAITGDNISYREQYMVVQNEFQTRTDWYPGDPVPRGYTRDRVEGDVTAPPHPYGLANNANNAVGQLRNQVLGVVLASIPSAGTPATTTRDSVRDRLDGQNPEVGRSPPGPGNSGQGEFLVRPTGAVLGPNEITVEQARSMFNNAAGRNSVREGTYVTIRWHSTLLADTLPGRLQDPPVADFVHPGDRHMTVQLTTPNTKINQRAKL